MFHEDFEKRMMGVCKNGYLTSPSKKDIKQYINIMRESGARKLECNVEDMNKYQYDHITKTISWLNRIIGTDSEAFERAVENNALVKYCAEFYGNVIQPFYNSCENYLNDATVNATCYLFKSNAEEKLRKIDNAKKDVSEMLEADNSRMYEYVKKAKEVKLLTDSLNDVEGYDVYKKRNTVEKRYNEINETTENISSLAVVGTLNMER